jgi:hypothetical protein
MPQKLSKNLIGEPSLQDELMGEFEAFAKKNGAKKDYEAYLAHPYEGSDELRALALRFRERVLSNAEERGVQSQTIAKCLRDTYGGLIRIRSERSNKGVPSGSNVRPPGALTKKQLDYQIYVISKAGKSLNLPERTIKELARALKKENRALATQSE